MLLIELLLCMRQVDTALDYIGYITSQFASTKNIQVLEKEPAEKKPIVFDAATDAFRLKLLQCQTRCYLMNKCLKGSKKELKTIMTTGGNVSRILITEVLFSILVKHTISHSISKIMHLHFSQKYKRKYKTLLHVGLRNVIHG